MGNCFAISSTNNKLYNDRKDTTASSAVSTASAVSSDGVDALPLPISNAFTAVFDGEIQLDKLFSICVDPNTKSFVIISCLSGLVVVSVSETSINRFTVCTPDGRSVAVITAKRSAKKTISSLSCSNKYSTSDGGIIKLMKTGTHKGKTICVANNGWHIDSVHRGIDLVIVAAFIAIKQNF
jgi:hypothetical protein